MSGGEAAHEGRTVGVAVIGAGGWGKNHVRNFSSLPGASLRYVCDRSETVRARFAASLPEVQCVPEAGTALADDEVDAVVIATDAPTHFEIAKSALEAGKDVFVEKPLALSAAHGKALCDAADEAGRILMTGHLLLYHPAVDALRHRIEAEELGDLLYLSSRRLNLGVVRQEENAWWSLAPHDLSVANYLLDAEPIAVSASGGTFLQKERGIEDVVFATVEYPGDRLAHLHVSWLDPHKTRQLTVVGTRKMAVFDDTSPDRKLTVYDKGVEPPPEAVSYAEGVRVRTGDIQIPVLRMVEPLTRECEAFIDAVRTRVPPRADGRSGLAVVRALEAGAQSLAEHGRRVPIEGDSP
jgi:predicted dehydrogenase